MRVLVTASAEWNENKASMASSAMSSALKKHGGDLSVVVGENKSHVEIARIASKIGVREVHFYYTSLERMHPPALDCATKITIATNESAIKFNNMIVDSVQSVIALDKPDNLALLAINRGVGVWFVKTNEVIKQSAKTY